MVTDIRGFRVRISGRSADFVEPACRNPSISGSQLHKTSVSRFAKTSPSDFKRVESLSCVICLLLDQASPGCASHCQPAPLRECAGCCRLASRVRIKSRDKQHFCVVHLARAIIPGGRLFTSYDGGCTYSQIPRVHSCTKGVTQFTLNIMRLRLRAVSTGTLFLIGIEHLIYMIFFCYGPSNGYEGHINIGSSAPDWPGTVQKHSDTSTTLKKIG